MCPSLAGQAARFLCLHPTTGLWDLEKGCKREPDCYGDQFGATVGSLEPTLCSRSVVGRTGSGDGGH
jgi:hypothetical protein